MPSCKPRKPPNARFAASAGHSLVESLVALAILSVGTLGMSALVLNNARVSQNAQAQTQALVLAQSMLERMRASAAGSPQPAFDIAVGVVPAGVNCGARDCAPADEVRNELAAWKLRLAKTLPAGDGGIQTVARDGMTAAAVTVVWDGRRAGGNFGAGVCAQPGGTCSVTVSGAL